jgi:hypothetical protein
MDGVPRDDEPSAPHRDSRSIVVTLLTRITPEANAQPREQLLALVVVYHVIYGPHMVTQGLQSVNPPFRQRVRHKAQPSAADSGRCSGAAARWFITPKRPGATCGAGEEYQGKYGPEQEYRKLQASFGMPHSVSQSVRSAMT